MRTAVFALTQQGVQCAGRVLSCLEEGAELFLPERFLALQDAPAASLPAAADKIHGFARLRPAVQQVFPRVEAMVFIMATGIVVRMIAPLLRNKLEDPAVVVLDEQGHHVISLLSGHVGGANSLTHLLAGALGADPVITTATDVEGLMAPDAWASGLGLRPWPKPHIQTVNTALLEKRPLPYYVSPGMPARETYEGWLTAHGLDWQIQDGRAVQKGPAVILAPERELPPLQAVPDDVLCLVPRPLLAGVGCKRGMSAAHILEALQEACRRIGMPLARIAALGSTDVKSDEAGLLAAAAELARPLHFFSQKELAEAIAAYGLQESPFVKKTIGVGNVCEAAAACCSKGRVHFALLKTRFAGVTVALAWGS
ncbi:cobalamin biosynthesis protein CbiG [Mitsuokella sp. AF33-22]|uniref:cobalt-precorrin 5A hydrolase n=1 Tax=Mitsuokella sp. AF33-22 TaxID=2292047 RepID=UPI000E529686|nr:cobalamin biosynthesis protein [Mitsuokella sp. AF33-22]RHM54406.1 cobalamin biosynthesis protein CbiG [Mitsuokella sp. AF33-22]